MTSTIAKSILTDRNSEYGGTGDVIELFIPPEVVPMLNPAETYLKFIVDIKDTNLCVQPDERAGAASLISEIQIFDGQNQTLLEQLEDFNTWTATYNHYNQTSGLRNMRTLMEGQSRSQPGFVNSLYYTPNLITGNTYRPVEVCLPLHMSGIFSPQSSIFPVLLTSGLRLRFTMESSVRALKLVTTAGVTSVAAPAIGAATADVQPVPVPAPPDNPNSLMYELAVVVAGAAPIAQLSVKKVATGGGSNCNSNTCPFRIGQQIGYGDNAGRYFNCGEILTIVDNAANIEFTFAAVTPPAPNAAGLGRPVFVFSDKMVNIVGGTPNYKIRNVEMVCSVVEAKQEVVNAMIQKVNSGSVKIDYTSFNIYRNNLNAGVNRPNILFDTTEHRAMSLLSYPMNTQNSFLTSDLQSVGDGMLNYQYNIANRLTPNRRVSVNRVASRTVDLQWNAIHQHELKKALSRGKVNPRYLCENKKMYGIGRELAKKSKSFDANNQDIRLDMEYSTAATDNQLEKLLTSWMYHIRTLVISQNSLAVVY